MYEMGSFEELEANTPLEQRLLVDQDLFRSQVPSMRTYSKRMTMSLVLDRCDQDDEEPSAKPLKEISLDGPSNWGRSRPRHRHSEPKKPRYDENQIEEGPLERLRKRNPSLSSEPKQLKVMEATPSPKKHFEQEVSMEVESCSNSSSPSKKSKQKNKSKSRSPIKISKSGCESPTRRLTRSSRSGSEESTNLELKTPTKADIPPESEEKANSALKSPTRLETNAVRSSSAEIPDAKVLGMKETKSPVKSISKRTAASLPLESEDQVELSPKRRVTRSSQSGSEERTVDDPQTPSKSLGRQLQNDINKTAEWLPSSIVPLKTELEDNKKFPVSPSSPRKKRSILQQRSLMNTPSCLSSPEKVSEKIQPIESVNMAVVDVPGTADVGLSEEGVRSPAKGVKSPSKRAVKSLKTEPEEQVEATPVRRVTRASQPGFKERTADDNQAPSIGERPEPPSSTVLLDTGVEDNKENPSLFKEQVTLQAESKQSSSKLGRGKKSAVDQSPLMQFHPADQSTPAGGSEKLRSLRRKNTDIQTPLKEVVEPLKSENSAQGSAKQRSTRSSMPVLSVEQKVEEENESSDEDSSISWDDNLEYVKYPNSSLENSELLDNTELLEEETTTYESCLFDDSKLSHFSDQDVTLTEEPSVVQDPSLTTTESEEDADEGYEFKKGAAVLAKLGKWPFWPAFVVPYHNEYRKILHKKPAFHVVFCSDNHERAWIPLSRLEPFISFESYKESYETCQLKPNPYDVPKKLQDKWQDAISEILKFQNKSAEYSAQFEVKIPEPSPPPLTAEERMLLRQQSKEERARQVEERRMLRRQEHREQVEQRSRLRQEQRELLRQLKEEAKAQIVRNVCIQCRDHKNTSPVVRCSKCDFFYHFECQGVNKEEVTDAFVCGFCTTDEMPCFVCFKHSAGMLRCKVAKCGKPYHEACLRHRWPQASLGHDGKGGNMLISCPAHSCHSCIHKDIFNYKRHIEPREKLVRCTKCPSSYHKDEACIPAGAIRINSHQIQCPLHEEVTHKSRSILCQLCTKPLTGKQEVWPCNGCPRAYHKECLDEDDDWPLGQNNFFCIACMDGYFPKVGDPVWAKYGSSRWWPARVIGAKDIPVGVEAAPHKPGQFVVRFYGTDNYAWIYSRSCFHIESEDDVVKSRKQTPAKSLERAFYEGLDEALQYLEQHDLELDSKIQVFYSNALHKKPAHYRRLKNNLYVPPCRPIKDKKDFGICRCKITDPEPCGENCDNRKIRMECLRSCQCGESCRNQRMQRHQNAKTELRFMGAKGWGLVAMEPLKQGDFVVEYVGEVVTTEEFQRRREMYARNEEPHVYFLKLSAHQYIDAKAKGNRSRFMNHSCEPNCVSEYWQVDREGRVGMFAKRAIAVDEELTFNYGWERDGSAMKQCFCGASSCQTFIAKAKETAAPSLQRSKPGRSVKGAVSGCTCPTADEQSDIDLACPVCYQIKEF